MRSRVELAEQFLQEAVYRSRGAQAGAGLFASGDPDRGDCGLGERAAVVLDLSPRAEEVFGLLWPQVGCETTKKTCPSG